MSACVTVRVVQSSLQCLRAAVLCDMLCLGHVTSSASSGRSGTQLTRASKSGAEHGLRIQGTSAGSFDGGPARRDIARHSTASKPLAEADVRIITPRLPVNPTHQQQEQLPQQYRPQHSKGRVASLAEALRLNKSQVSRMLNDYPALANYNHARLADKVAQMAQMLQLHPQQLTKSLVAKPKVLGMSLAEFESRIRELQKLLGPLDTLSQLVLQEPKLLSWSANHLSQRIANMSSCLGIQQPELLELLIQHPQMLPASSNWVRCLQVLQQLMHMAEVARQRGFGTDDVVAEQQQQQQQKVGSQEQLLQEIGVVGQQMQQLMAMQAQQQQQENSQYSPTQMQVKQQQLLAMQHLHQKLQQLQAQLQQLQQQQQQAQQMSSMIAAQKLALQHPQLLLVQPEDLLAEIAAMQARSGLSVAEVAAVVVANPSLLWNSVRVNKQQQDAQKQQRPQQPTQGHGNQKQQQRRAPLKDRSASSSDSHRNSAEEGDAAAAAADSR